MSTKWDSVPNLIYTYNNEGEISTTSICYENDLVKRNKKLSEEINELKDTITKLTTKTPIKDVVFSGTATIVYFNDGWMTKAVCDADDKFSKEMGVLICLAKYLFKEKSYDKIMDTCFSFEKARKAEAEAKELEEKRIAKKKEKNRLRKERRKNRKREEQIEILSEAYVRALKKVNDYNKDKEVIKDTITKNIPDAEDEVIALERLWKEVEE